MGVEKLRGTENPKLLMSAPTSVNANTVQYVIFKINQLRDRMHIYYNQMVKRQVQNVAGGHNGK